MVDYNYINNLENTLVKENRHLNMADVERACQHTYDAAIGKACKVFNDAMDGLAWIEPHLKDMCEENKGTFRKDLMED